MILPPQPPNTTMNPVNRLGTPPVITARTGAATAVLFVEARVIQN
jgi:hypothetical protein